MVSLNTRYVNNILHKNLMLNFKILTYTINKVKMLQRSKITLHGLLVIFTTAVLCGSLFIYFSKALPPVGDINGDSFVNITDLSLLLSSYGQNTTQCITNSAFKCDLSSPSDGVVNVLDLSIILSNYGKSVSQAGHILYMEATGTDTDAYTNNPTTATQQWMRDHWDRALVFTSYWDSRLSWYPNAWVYQDSYAIYVGSALATQHPDWILKDASGNKLYIPFACNGTSCTQYAGDIGNPAFRQYYIDNAKATLAKGYKGLFVDDVNMDFRVGNVSGAFVNPIDPRTGAAMSEDTWRRYFAEFMEQVRTSLPNTEIVHNSIWYAGGGNHDDTNQYVIRELKSADYINFERGINDAGLTGGTAQWSLYRLLGNVDVVHSYGSHVIFDSYATDLPGMEYNLAGYFLVNDGRDFVTTSGGNNPTTWWSAYDIDLGNASGPRYQWNGLWRRDFDNGFVLLNEPGSTTKTVSLGGTFKNTSGTPITSSTLSANQGAVLQK
jgi:hypothetical protein